MNNLSISGSNTAATIYAISSYRLITHIILPWIWRSRHGISVVFLLGYLREEVKAIVCHTGEQEQVAITEWEQE
jgi:hypothetical protein